MVAEFRGAEHDNNTIDLVVRNVGPSVARDVRVGFDPAITLPDDTSQLVTPFLVQRYDEAIPSVGPGQELKNVWFSGRPESGQQEMVNVEPTPDSVTIRISYRGVGRKVYHEEFPLHVNIVKMTTYSTSTDSTRGRIDSIHRSLKSLAESATACAKAADFVRRDEIAAQQEANRATAERFGATRVPAEADEPSSADES